MKQDDLKARIFCGVFSTGISFADSTKQEHGNYKRLAHLSFSTLELQFYGEPERHIADYIKALARELQDRRGEQYQISASGQTITLGYALADQTLSA